MQNINLLPQKPVINTRSFRKAQPFLIIAVGVLLLGGLWYYINHLTNEKAIISEQIKQLQEQRKELIKDRTIDPKTAIFQKFSQAVSDASKNRRNWPPALDALKLSIPTSGMLDQIQADEKGLLTLRGFVNRVTDVADYATLLKKHSVVQDVRVKSVKAIESQPAGMGDQSQQYPYEFTIEVQLKDQGGAP